MSAPDASPSLPDLDALQADLGDVDAAMSRIEDGTYGQCEVCGDRISDEILADDPRTLRCDQHRSGPGAVTL